LTDTKFGDYVAMPHAGKMRFAAAVRARVRLGGRNPYPRIVRAIADGLRGGDFSRLAADAVRLADARDVDRFRSIAFYFAEYLASNPGLVLAEEKPAVYWSHPDLVVKVSPHFVVKHPDGRYDALRLWMRDTAPPAVTVQAELGLLASTMRNLWPGAAPVLLDTRRTDGEHRALIRPLPETKAWLDQEAAQFGAAWRA
jgi:hypothetical protein